GVPVITSNLDPMREVSGGKALYADPHHPEELAAAFRQLDTPAVREKVVADGLENTQRFTNERMTCQYLELHDLRC
ncbi:MAG: glycosyltransferase family 1 protein, partial [Bacteroidota bacterium]